MLFDQLAAVGNEGAQFPDMHGGHPDPGDEVGRQEPGQADGVVGVGFDGCLSDPFDLEGVGDHATADQGGQEVDVPGIAGGFQDDGIGGAKVGLGPGGEVVQVDAFGFEDDLLVSIHGSDDHEVFVEVDAHETGRTWVVH